VDPYYLSWKARLAGYEPKFMNFADEINSQMPLYVVQMVAEALEGRGKTARGANILVLGVAYKAGVGDTRESPALEILEHLLEKGARVAFTDPHVPTLTVNGKPLVSVRWEALDLPSRDLVLILTDHSSFDYERVVRESALVVDTRNATRRVSAPRPHVITL
jgi:UDP-N-acetyl-D-glucosamine dehydrogenase